MARAKLRLVCVAGVLLLVGGALCLLFWVDRGEGGSVGLGRPTTHAPVGTNADTTDAANLRGSCATQSEPVPSQPSPEPREPGWSCEVSGRIVGLPEPARVAPSRYRVSITVLPAALGVELTVASDGTFGGPVPLPGPQATLACIARDTEGHGVSVLLRRRVTSGQRVGLVFFLVDGAAIVARVVDADGQPVPDAAIRTFERPSKESPLLPSLALESNSPATRVAPCDEEGRVRITVRPGRIWWCPLGLDGAWGATQTASLEAGETLDLGDVLLPGASIPIRGRIVDAVSGEPVVGAWIHLDGQAVRWQADGQPAATIHTDAAGIFSVPHLSEAALPIHGAVGSPTHEAAEVVFRGGPGAQDLLIELQPRPTLRIRLARGGTELGAEGEAAIHGATWSVKNIRRHSGGGPAGHGSSSLYWIRDALLHTRTPVQTGPGPGEAHCFPPFAGEYEIRMSLAGRTRCVARANVEAGKPGTVLLETPEGLPTRIRLHVPQDPAAYPAKGPLIQMAWLAAGGDVLAPAGTLRYAPDGDSMDTTLWRPAGATGLQAGPREYDLSPYVSTTATLDTSPGSLTHVHLERRADTALLELQLVYAGEPIPMGEACIVVVPSDPDAPALSGRTPKSDARGHAVLRIPPGAYRVVSLTRFGPPKWVDVTASPGQVTEVLVPVEP